MMHRKTAMRIIVMIVLLISGCGRKWDSPVEPNNEPPSEGLVAWYPFNGDANDESGNGNHGVVTGATLTLDRFGINKKAFSFNGINNYIIVNNSSSIQPKTTLTVSVWLNVSGYPTDARDGWAGIISKRINDDASPWDSYLVSVHKDKYLQFCAYGSRDAVKLNDVPLSTWIFAVGIVDGNMTRLYINGLLCDTTAYEGTILYSSSSLRIGTLSLTRLNPFFGKIDDIRIYNRALSEAEIQLLYHEGGWAD